MSLWGAKRAKFYIDDSDPVISCTHAYINGFINKGDKIIILITGGDKSSQKQYIEKAKEIIKELKEDE